MLLDENRIQRHLKRLEFHAPLGLHILDSIDSTNRYLKDLATLDEIVLCCAETQTQGRGRFQRTWFSPHGENIYGSIRWHFPNPNHGLSTLSLVIGLAIVQTLQSQVAFDKHDTIRIKWPNDLIWQDKKLCGILIETTPHPVCGLYVIIGIGLNVNSDSRRHQSKHVPDKPWCSLYDITQQILDRNSLIAHLLTDIQQYIALFKTNGLAAFITQWQTVDYLHGKTVEIVQGKQIIHGIAHGINERGELLILDQHHQECQIPSGEASVILHQ